MGFIKEWGMIAGFAGLALGAVVFLFREVIRKKIFSKLSKQQSFTILLVVMVLITGLSVYSINLYFSNESDGRGQLTVLVHGENGKDDVVLPNRGEVKLIYGDAIVLEKINDKGEATFKQLPAEFFDEKATVEILFSDPEGEPYSVAYPDSVYHLTAHQYIPLEVRLAGLHEIKGIVKDFETGEFIDSARVSILGAETYSNEFGEYFLTIPTELQKQFQTIRAMKKGYNAVELTDIPTQTENELPILLKKKVM